MLLVAIIEKTLALFKLQFSVEWSEHDLLLLFVRAILKENPTQLSFAGSIQRHMQSS